MLPAHRRCRHTPLDPRRFRVRRVGTSVLAVSGDVDLAAAPALATALALPDVDCVDLSAVTFMDATGLAVLLAAHGDRAGGLALRSPSRCVARLLALTGHDATLRVAWHGQAQRRSA